MLTSETLALAGYSEIKPHGIDAFSRYHLTLFIYSSFVFLGQIYSLFSQNLDLKLPVTYIVFLAVLLILLHSRLTPCRMFVWLIILRASPAGGDESRESQLEDD